VSGADGGALRQIAPGRETSTSWTHDPGDLVPSLTLSDFHVLPTLPDESEAHARRDVVTFTSETLAADLDILGDVGAVLEVRASCPALPLIVALHHVSERRATIITEGSVSAFVGGGWATVPVDLGAVGYRVPRGDRIRISLSTSRFPRFLPPSGTVGSDWLASERLPFDVELRAGAASRLLLPILTPGAAP
jgi:predicted acyl esterase